MKISKDSMIYRSFMFNRPLFGLKPDDCYNLCAFVRTYLIYVGRTMVRWGTLGFLGLCVVAFLSAMTARMLFGFLLVPHALVDIGLIVSGSCSIIMLLLFFLWIAQFCSDKWGCRKPKQPNIIFEYIKAKKNKICPLVEFVD